MNGVLDSDTLRQVQLAQLEILKLNLIEYVKKTIYHINCVKRHSKVPTFGQEIPHLLLSFPNLVSAIYDSGITFFSSICIYSRSL